MKKLISYLFKKFCVTKHKFGRSDIVVRDNNRLSRAEVTNIFYDKHLVPVYEINPYGMGKRTFISESDDDFSGWKEFKGVPPGLVDLESPTSDPDAKVSVKRAEDVKVSKTKAAQIVKEHKAQLKAKKK